MFDNEQIGYCYCLKYMYKNQYFLKNNLGGEGGVRTPRTLRNSHPESSHFVGPPTKYQLSYFDLTVQLVIFQKNL